MYTAVKGSGYPVDQTCAVLHISRSAYYKWNSGKLSPRQKENEEIANKLEQMHMEDPAKGYRRLRDDLEVYHGISVNDKRVLRICRKCGIKESLNKSAAAVSGSFAATYRFENLEIHKVFLRFSNLNLQQNLSLTAAADLFRASLSPQLNMPTTAVPSRARIRST